jgi:AcrR family transcriptional regulator
MSVHLSSSRIVNYRSFIYNVAMSPRPRTTSDADLLMATQRVISRLGPARFTLADVAAECGLSPATLLQRFGSKRGLLLALASQGSPAVAKEMAALRAAQPTPLAALRAFADCMAGMAASPEELANHLAFLTIDLTDAEFHRHALEQAQVFQKELHALLDAAVAAREITSCDTGRLARLVQEMLHGALVTWAIYRKGTARDWLRQELQMLLAPYMLEKRRARSGRRGCNRGSRV